MHYLGGPNLITRAFSSGEHSQVESERCARRGRKGRYRKRECPRESTRDKDSVLALRCGSPHARLLQENARTESAFGS